VRGTGPEGAIQIADVEGAAAGAAPAAPAEERGRRLRQTIAAAMARSKREIPHYYLATTVDLHATLEWIAGRNLERKIGDRLLPGAVLLKAVARALRETPALNAVWRGDHAEPLADVHVGVAISLRGGGLVAPAIHHTDRLPIDELTQRLKDLVTRTRAGTLRSSELSDGTITVTSLGDQGVESVLGVVYPPQVAIVGFGKIVERPWSVAGEVVSRRVVTATLAADHRVTDGHLGGRFLAAVDRLLQKPEDL
jgi:pyruvate dehydrogenase E2 component (dihydrolipoamide acetyltransferase)